jgi:hypothetical protein
MKLNPARDWFQALKDTYDNLGFPGKEITITRGLFLAEYGGMHNCKLFLSECIPHAAVVLLNYLIKHVYPPLDIHSEEWRLQISSYALHQETSINLYQGESIYLSGSKSK